MSFNLFFLILFFMCWNCTLREENLSNQIFVVSKQDFADLS